MISPNLTISSRGTLNQTIPSPFTRGFRVSSSSNAAIQSLETVLLWEKLVVTYFFIIIVILEPLVFFEKVSPHASLRRGHCRCWHCWSCPCSWPFNVTSNQETSNCFVGALTRGTWPNYWGTVTASRCHCTPPIGTRRMSWGSRCDSSAWLLCSAFWQASAYTIPEWLWRSKFPPWTLRHVSSGSRKTCRGRRAHRGNGNGADRVWGPGCGSKGNAKNARGGMQGGVLCWHRYHGRWQLFEFPQFCYGMCIG